MMLAELSSVRNVLIYGYGLEGRSTERFLARRYPTMDIDIHDNHIPELTAAKALACYDVLILSPGVPREFVAGVSPAKVTSQAEIFFANLPERQRSRVIGITASKGKSTTATFCAQMLANAGLAVAIGGNFGSTFLELFDDVIDDRYDFVVAELSSFQLEHLTVSPGIAVFLNIFPEHLDHHKSFDRYFAAKSNLWRHQQFPDFLVAAEVTRQELGTHPELVYFAAPMAERCLPLGTSYRASHFRRNLGTMVTLAHLLDIPDEVVHDTAREFRGLPHRMECFAELQGITFYDDSAATNVDATLAAVEALGENIGSIILGGVNPNVNYEPLVDGILTYAPQAHLIVMYTEVRAAIVVAVGGRALRYSIAVDLPDVVRHAFAGTPRNTVCVLSPAAKSFDWFKDYHHRGESFKTEVLTFRHHDSGPLTSCAGEGDSPKDLIMTPDRDLERRTQQVFHGIHLAHLGNPDVCERHTGTIEPERMGLPLDFLAGLRCADLGCGSAVHGTVNMLELGAGSVNAMDLDASFIEPAENRLRQRVSFDGRWQLDIGSLIALPYPDEYFDFVLCSGVVHHVVDDRKAMIEIHRVMKPGARAYLSVAGRGGLLNRLFLELLRDEWAKNPEMRTTMRSESLEEWIKQQISDLKGMIENDHEESYNASMALLDNLAELIDNDLVLSIIDVVEAPIYKAYTEDEWFSLLNVSGFQEYYRFSKRPKYKNVRKIFAPLYEDRDHPLARLLYGTGYMNVVVTKSVS